MRWWSQFRSWVDAMLRRSRLESEMDAELRFHIEAYAEDLMRSGVSREEALRRARLEFGGMENAKEECREARGVSFLESLLQDVRYGVRVLRKTPGFTTVAILTLALGIGVNAAIFGLVDSTLLQALPFREPERLVHVWTTDAGGDLHTPLPSQYLALWKYSQAFEQISGTGWVDSFYGNDESHLQNLPGLAVTPNWLPTLGIQPLLGRNFFDEEQTAGQDSVVMLSYGCWRTRFHADPRIIGKQIVLNRRPVTVVGVLPQSVGFYYENIEIFAPFVPESYASVGKLRVAGAARVQIIARLKPGVTMDQTRAETEAIAEGMRSPSATDRSGHLVVEDFAEMLRHPGPTMQNARQGMWLMAAAAGAVLLIACANVASLLVARGVKRQKEVALRVALGCSRSRMIRQLLTESTLLFLCGGSLGLALAQWSKEIITKVASGIVSNTAYLEVNARVLTAGLCVSFLSALFFGMIPALQATRVNINDNLKDTASNATGSSRSRRPRNLLVVFQIALGMVLLVSFGLLFRSLLHLESSPLGYDPHNVVTATVSLPVSNYADLSTRARLMHQAIERVRLMPSVESAGIVDSLPMQGADSTRLRIEVPSTKLTSLEEEIWFLTVSPEYFSTLKIAMLAGRSFNDGDSYEASSVAIVNETFAKKYFPGTSPVGYHVALADSPTISREIVGVVSDFRQRNPEEDLRALAYFPVAQTLQRERWSMAIRVRSSNDMANVEQGLGNWLRPLDPQLYWEMDTMQQQIHDSESLTMRRPIITLLAGFGSLSLVLAVVGVFGVTSYSVTERTREIGIRAALGAARKEIVGLMLRETFAVTLAGLAVGTQGALALARVFPTGPIGWSGSGIFLYGVSRTDTLTYACAAALLAGVALAASWIPARRASRVDPMVALRHE